MPREKYQTRLPADTGEQVDEYIDEHEISQSEAIRRLVEAGLEANDQSEGTDTERAGQRGTIYFLVVVLLLVLNLVATLGVI